jgi:hypothetical protein
MVTTQKIDLSQFKSETVKFVEIGDTIAGELLDMSIETNNLDKTKNVLKLMIRDSETGAERPVYCPTMLAAAVAEEEPDIGDFVRATLTGFRNTGMPSPLKEFHFADESRNGQALSQDEPF